MQPAVGRAAKVIAHMTQLDSVAGLAGTKLLNAKKVCSLHICAIT